MRAAVKVLHGQWASHHEFRTRFIDEATAAAQARHENIVQIFDVGVSSDGVCYMVMELLEGRTLRQLHDVPRICVTWRHLDGCSRAHSLCVCGLTSPDSRG